MIARLIALSARNPALILLSVLLAAGVGLWATLTMPVDAIPDLSDTQVIVYSDYPGQAPQLVEDQVTFPLSTALLAVPRAKVVRGVSDFGASFVYVIFADGTDLNWARSRVLEYLNSAARFLPAGVAPVLGPDASGVGWVFQYAVVGVQRSLAELRALQDWLIRFQLAASGGVAEVAAVGGFERQYQVVVDPRRLQGYGIPLARVAEAIRGANREVGGRTIELSEREFMLRGRGYLTGIGDLERVVLKSDGAGSVTLRDVAHVELGPDERRGIAELDGTGEVVGGIVVKRDGADTNATIAAVKRRLAELLPALPPGVSIRTVYDRSALIGRAIATLDRALLEEAVIVSLVCMLFLLHVRSALVAILTLPAGVLLSFAAMRLLGLGSNIMSLGGIAIALGAMVDAAIVMIENAHKHVERLPPGAPRRPAILAAAQEVGPSLFFSLLVIVVSFLPVFALEDQEGRLFKPLAATKSFAMAAGALLSVTLVPALMTLLIRGRLPPEGANPLNRLLLRLYRPLIGLVLRAPVAVLALAVAISAASLWPLTRLGSEFMPTLDEGSLFLMPVTQPGLSVTKAAELLQTQDRILKSFPEVETVFGKAGRANSATDPAPLDMFETVVTLKPKRLWRPGLTTDRLVAEMDKALQLPGVANAWTMPIKARIDMLSTGIRTPVGVKLFGPDLGELQRLAERVEAVLRRVPGTRSVYAERVGGGHYVEILPDRDALVRYGLQMGEVMDTVAAGLGGETVTTAVEGRQRFNVTLRYPRGLRDDPQAIAAQLLVPTPGGAMIPLGQLAELRLTAGPPSIRTENAELVDTVTIDLGDRDIGGYVAEASAAVAAQVALPPGYHLRWSGQYESIERAAARLRLVVPATLALIAMLLYANFRRLSETLIVLASVPFALVGGVWLLWGLDYRLSVAVAVGLIALAGVAAETGVVMLIYLDQALAAARAAAGRALTRPELRQAVIAGAVERVRPKMMTVTAIMAGLLPILWSDGSGAEVMRRIAVPMVGGMLSSTALTLLVIPALYLLVKGRNLH